MGGRRRTYRNDRVVQRIAAVFSLAVLTEGADVEADVAPRDRPLAILVAVPGTDVAGPGRPRRLRASIETVVAVGIGTAFYWLRPGDNLPDWDGDSVTDRFTTSVLRFDTNGLWTNFFSHPAAGAGFYLLGRLNRMSVLESTLVLMLGSILWEYVVEFREKVSVNDIVSTAIGGIAAGELFFLLGDYVRSAPGGGDFIHRAVGAVLGFPRLVHDWLDGVGRPPPGPTDSLGFGAEWTHRFHLTYGVGAAGDAQNTRTVHDVGLELALVAGEDPGAPAERTRFFADGGIADGSLRLRFGEEGNVETDLWFGADLGGFHGERGDTASGVGLLAALSVGMRYRDRNLLGTPDAFAFVHFPGPDVRVWAWHGQVRVAFQMEGHLDFAGIHSLAFPAWEDANGSEGIKSVLDREGYTYATGISVRLGANVAYGDVDVAGTFRYGAYDSIEGLDRTQEDVTRDVDADEGIREWTASAGVRPGGGPFELRALVEGYEHRSGMGGFTATLTEHVALAQIGLVF